MKNKLAILMILLIPLMVFVVLENSIKTSSANASVQNQTNAKAKLIKFYSPMCSECKELEKNVKNAMKDYKDDVIYEEINVSEKNNKTKTLIEGYRITVVPTVIFLDKYGRTIEKYIGVMEEDEVRNNLDKIK